MKTIIVLSVMLYSAMALAGGPVEYEMRCIDQALQQYPLERKDLSCDIVKTQCATQVNEVHMMKCKYKVTFLGVRDYFVCQNGQIDSSLNGTLGSGLSEKGQNTRVNARVLSEALCENMSPCDFVLQNAINFTDSLYIKLARTFCTGGHQGKEPKTPEQKLKVSIDESQLD